MIKQKRILALLASIFMYQLLAMQEITQPVLVTCSWFNCKRKVAVELKKHHQNGHSQTSSLALTVNKKIIKQETQKCKQMSYRKFCELESKIRPSHALHVSRSAINKIINKRSKITQKYLEQLYDAYCRYECCKKFDSQRSSQYRQHVLKCHPHLYDFHHCLRENCSSVHNQNPANGSSSTFLA